MTFQLPFDREPMRILVACETSGRVRDAFRRRGHDAWSCDLLPDKNGSPHHLQMNALEILDPTLYARSIMLPGGSAKPWNMLIAHPPCTKLTVSAAWCMYHPDDKELPVEQRRPHPDFPDRRREQDEAAEFFMRFVDAPIEKKAIENPIGAMSTRYRQPDQVVQPYWFGDDASKATCFWLFGLPTIPVPPRSQWAPGRLVVDPDSGKTVRRWANQTDNGQNRLSPSEDRWALRSETYPGIAEAMGENWG